MFPQKLKNLQIFDFFQTSQMLSTLTVFSLTYLTLKVSKDLRKLRTGIEWSNFNDSTMPYMLNTCLVKACC